MMLTTIKTLIAKFTKGVIIFFLFSLLSSYTIHLDTDSSDSDSETGKGKRITDPVKSDQVSLTQSDKVSESDQVIPQSDKVSDWDQISPKTIPSQISDSNEISPLTLPKPVSSVGEGDKAGTYKLDYRTLADTPRPSGGSSAAIFARLQGMYAKVVEVEHEDKKKECIDQGLHKMDYSMMTEDQKNTSDSYVSTSNSLTQAYGLLNKYNAQVFKENSSASSSTTQDTSNLTKRRLEEALSEAPSKKRLTSDSSSEDERNYPRPQKDNRSDDGHDSDKGHYSDEEL